MKISSKLMILIKHLTLIAVSIITAVPLFWIIVTSVKERPEALTRIPQWIPNKIILTNFVESFFRSQFNFYFLNTIKFVIVCLFIQLCLTILAAYAFGRMNFWGRDVLFFILLTQMMISPQALMIPNYITISSIGLLDTVGALIAPYLASAYGTFLLRQSFKTIPKEFEDAAFIDGCGRMKFLIHIGIPMVKPAIVTFSLFSIVYHWNEFFWPLLVTNSTRSRVITIGLSLLSEKADSGAEWTLLMAAILIVIAPLLIFFIILQRQFIESMMQSGIKG